MTSATSLFQLLLSPLLSRSAMAFFLLLFLCCAVLFFKCRGRSVLRMVSGLLALVCLVYGVFILFLVFAFGHSDGRLTERSGEVVEWSTDGDTALSSFVVQTEEGDRFGVLMTGQTIVLPSDALSAEDFLRAGGGLAILADGEPMAPEQGDADADRAVSPLVPGERAEIVTADTDYGRRLAARTDPSWEELSHARWGVLGQESRAGYRCLDLWLCDNYEDNGIRDLPEVTVYDDWDALLQAAEAGDIDALPLKPGLRTEELSLLAETEGIVAQVAAVREDEALQSRAFALALEAAVSRLPEAQREALLGAKDFVSLQASGLDATRRSLAGR